jgi:Tfp pilus assembly protein PilX
VRPTFQQCGFVLPAVLGIIMLAAFIAIQAASELGSTSLLANQRQLHQRAFEAGESGLIAILDQLQSGATPAALQELGSTAVAVDGAAVETRLAAHSDLPLGYSAGRVLESRYELRSTGHSARGTRVTVTQGVRHLLAAPDP